MKLTRRQFTLGAAASVAAVQIPSIASAKQSIKLHARPGLAQLVPKQYPATPIWGYNGSAPGPVLKIKQGEKLVCEFKNGLSQASTIHWHGIRIDNKMDGVPDLTQDVVAPKGNFLYEFAAPDAGTFWYHPHNRTSEQMARGLYGALIVEEKSPPEVDRDEILLIDDWRLDQNAEVANNFSSMMDWSHGGRFGNWLTVNGKAPYTKKVGQNERLRLRLINTANARIFSLGLEGLAGWVVALDGQPLEQPFAPERLTLAPAQRIDLIVDVTGKDGAAAQLFSTERGKKQVLASFAINGSARPDRLTKPAALAPNPVAKIDPRATPHKVTLQMSGGAMGRMQSATIGGEMKNMRELITAGKAWAFNGQADMPDKPLLNAARGALVHIKMVNDTSWPHAMHLHGFHFRTVSKEGQLGPLRDTLLMDRDETVTIAFVADNPGNWLLHCHMLEHAASGMTTWIKVA